MATGRDTLLKNDLPAGLVVFLVALPLCLGVALASNAPLLSGIISRARRRMRHRRILRLTGECQRTGGRPGRDCGRLDSIPRLIPGIPRRRRSRRTRTNRARTSARGCDRRLRSQLGDQGRAGGHRPEHHSQTNSARTWARPRLDWRPELLGAGRAEYLFRALQAPFERGPADRWSSRPAASWCSSPGTSWPPEGRVCSSSFRRPAGGGGSGNRDESGLPERRSCLVYQRRDAPRQPAFGVVPRVVQRVNLPDFSVLSSSQVWTTSRSPSPRWRARTLLSLEAAESHRPTEAHFVAESRTLVQGVGNVVSGMLGGLPVTSVVLRTSANVAAGGRAWKAAFVHGLLLLGAVSLLAGVLNLVPLASLAAVLIMVGYKLTKVSLYRSAYDWAWTNSSRWS